VFPVTATLAHSTKQSIYVLDRRWVYCEVVSEHYVGKMQFLGAFAKLRNAIISFVMSVCPHGTTRLPLDGFSWNLVFEYFSKFRRENSSVYEILTRITGTLHADRYTFFLISSRSVLRMRNVSRKFVQKIKTYILCSMTLVFRNSCRLRGKVEKYCASGQATAHNMAHADCMLDT